MPYENVNGLQVYYEVHGEGEVIILMHHGFGSSRIWDAIHPRFTTLGYKVVTFDRRGYGRSEGGDDFQEFYESDRYRPESVEELRIMKERLGIGPCHLVGQCEGGVVGVDYAGKYPEEVKTLVAGSTQCYSEITMTELNALKFPTKFAGLDPSLQAKMIKWHGETAERNYDQFAKYGGAYGVGYFNLRPALQLVACPSLVLYPDRSAIFAVEQAIAFYRNLAKGELAIFPKCGHNTYEQRPEDYTRTILDFIMRNAGGIDSRVGTSMTCLA
jgi:pimeloyl-ACP methyl ester carboxylesterase